MKKFSPLIAALAFSSAFAAADPVEGREEPSRIDAVERLGLDARRAGQVEAILANALERMTVVHELIGPATDETTRTTMRAAMHAIEVDAQARLATVLTPEELAKLEAARGRPRPFRG